jgi:uncharacterized OB-fold protein
MTDQAEPGPHEENGIAPDQTSKVLAPIEVARCESCRQISWYPRAVCVKCGSATAPSAEYLTGRVYSLTEVHRAPGDFRADAPYEVALIDCDEGIRVLARAPGTRIGMAVVVGTAVDGGKGEPMPYAQPADVNARDSK